MKRLLALLLCFVLVLGLTGCKDKDAELMGNYKAEDSLVQVDVGALVEASFAPMLTEFYICDISHDMLDTDYVFDEEKPDRKGSVFVINRTTNELVFGYRMDELFFPASLTKLMTALVTMERCSFDEKVIISKEVGEFARGSVSELKEGDVLTVKDLLMCLLVSSATNASIALAEHVAGSEEAFVELMNAEIKRLGGRNTTFKNASGLHDEKHKTTPYDVYIVYQECMKYKEFREIVGITEKSYEYTDAKGKKLSRKVYTTNCFKTRDEKEHVDYPSSITILGSKTGTTNAAGYCMILHIQNRAGTEYLIGVFRAENKDKLYGKLNELMTTYCLTD